MKIKDIEIIKDHIDSPSHSRKDNKAMELILSNGAIVGSFETTEGDWSVKGIQSGNELLYGVLNEEQTKIIAFVILKIFKNLQWIMAVSAHAENEYKRRGIIGALVEFLVREKKLKILSDFELTTDGQNLWKHLILRSRVEKYIVNLSTEEIFDLDDVKNKKAKDGTTVENPFNDNKLPPKNISKIKKSEQRYVYLLEEFDIGQLTEEQIYMIGLGPKNRILKPPLRWGPELDIP